MIFIVEGIIRRISIYDFLIKDSRLFMLVDLLLVIVDSNIIVVFSEYRLYYWFFEIFYSLIYVVGYYV